MDMVPNSVLLMGWSFALDIKMVSSYLTDVQCVTLTTSLVRI
jgi:hypothetical protein